MKLIKKTLVALAVCLIPLLACAQTDIFINEINYLADPANAGTPDGPGLEISAPGGTELNGFKLHFLDATGSIYGSQDISGTVPNESVSRGDVWIEVVIFNITSGGGILMTDDEGLPIQLISFGGSIVGSSGILSGLSSEELEEQINPNNSLQLKGCGQSYTDFIWDIPGGMTQGELNTGQEYECVSSDGGLMILPVELLDFTAREINQHTYVQWETGVEINHDAFELEHSLDGISFEKITRINGTSTNNDGAMYSFLHRTPTTGINYYRLIQIDIDGKVQHLGVRSVHIGEVIPTPVVYPNPVREALQVKLPHFTGDIQVEILDEYGRIFYSNSFSNIHQLEIQVGYLPIGTYIFSVKNSEHVDYQRFTKI